MWTSSLSHFFVDILAGIFAVAAITGIAAARHHSEQFRQWRRPRQFYRIMGELQLFTALFLAVPQMRLLGIVLAGLTIFWVVVVLLNHRQWSWAAAGMLMMMTLPPASLAIR